MDEPNEQVGRVARARPERRTHVWAGLCLVGAVLAAFAVGCDSGIDVREARVVPVIYGPNVGLDGPQIVAPDTVERGASFQVEITVFGIAGCSRVGGTEVEYGQSAVLLHPYIYERRGVSCPRVYQSLVHEVAILSPEPGPLVISVVGQNADTPTSESITLQREVFVRADVVANLK